MSASERLRFGGAALVAFLVETRWGGQSLVALAVSVLSGLILALQYDPTTPLYSVGVLEALVPYGRYLRASHFYSSQLFFLLSLLHLLAVLLAKAGRQLRFDRWLLLLGSLPVSLLLLFTGYVLRGDATGEAAGQIAENITLSIPWFGEILNSLFFAIEAEGMKRVYVHHLIGLGVLWGVCCWDHLRRYRVEFAGFGLLFLGLLLCPLFFPAPLEPAQLGATYLPGPWFFLGLQELLRFIHPFWAGVAFPAIFFMVLPLIHPEVPRHRLAFALVSFWLAGYAGLTLFSLWR